MGPLASRGALPRALVRLGLSRPGLVLGAWLALAFAIAPAVLHLQIETSTGSVLDRSDEAWRFYQSAQQRFGGDEILTMMIEGDAPFDPAVLREVVDLTRHFEALEGVRRVDSLASVPHVQVSADGTLDLEPALARGVPEDAAGLAALRARVRNDRIAPRTLVSADERAFAINIVLERNAESRYPLVLGEIERLTAGRRAWFSGVPVFRVEADARTRTELLTFVPLTVLLVAALLYGIFRSPAAIVHTLVPVGTGCWVVLGAMAASGVPLTIATVILPSILLALGCAYALHLLAAARGVPREGLRAALEPVALPVALSGLTTAIGFVAIATVRIDAIREVGAYGALGVLVVLAATLTAVPALLARFPLPSSGGGPQAWISRHLPSRLTRLVERRAPVLLLVWVLAVVLFGTGIGRIRAETDVIEWFPRDDPIRVAYREIRDRLSGISPLNVVVEAQDGQGIAATEVIDAIDRLSARLQALPQVGRVVSIADPLRQLHGGFVGDASQPLPSGDALIAQYLLLLEAKPYTFDLITRDRSAANVLLRVNDNGSDALLDVARAARRAWAEIGPPGVHVRTTGIMYEFARAEHEIVMGQVRGLAAALLAVALLLVAMFRSVRLALIALVPNAVPVAIGFGVMGLVGIPLDAGTVILGSLALGIAVDDTVHVVEGFVRRRDRGLPPADALRATFDQVLPPVIFTSIAIGLGFCVLALSGFSLTRNLGLLTAGVMALCLLADLLLLPVLLLRFAPGPAPPPADTRKPA